MALEKQIRKAHGPALMGVGAQWKTDVGHVVLIAENGDALVFISNRLDGAVADPELFRDVACFLKANTEASDRRTIKFDLVAHLHRQRVFSDSTFGPGKRTAGVLDHIRKELTEIEASPGDLTEWVDVVLLALDGAWRAGFEPEQIAQAIAAKQERNESRKWPDWRTAEPGKAIEHVRDDREYQP